MPDLFDKEKRSERKAERQQKKDKRIAAKDLKLEQQISSEAGKYGIDLNQVPTGPMTEEAKKRITESIKQGAAKDLTSDIEAYSKAYQIPKYLDQPTLDKEKLKQDLRRQKRAKISDVLVALGRGFQGKEIDPSKFATSKIKQEREKQYQQFKDISMANKARAEQWESKYRDDLVNYLKDKIKDKKTSDLEKLKTQQILAQIEKTKVETAWKKNQPYYNPSTTKAKPTYTKKIDEGWQMTNKQNPYSDLYYKLTGNSPLLINELAKIAGHATDDSGALKRNLSSDEIERFSNSILSKAFDFKTDEQGNQIAVPKPGQENYISNLSNSINSINNLKSEKQKIQDELDAELYNISGWGAESKKEKLRAEYEPLLNEADSNIKKYESELNSLLGGNSTSTSNNSSSNTNNTDTSQQSTFLDIVNKYK